MGSFEIDGEKPLALKNVESIVVVSLLLSIMSIFIIKRQIPT
jgi:hypothetical protein